jgi:hypothetical protein
MYDKFLGYWDYRNREVNIFYPSRRDYSALNLRGFQETIAELRRTIRHETQHMGQDLIQDMKNLNEIAGLPSKKIRPGGKDYDPNTGEWVRPHPERDVEFYTRMSDEVDTFARMVTKFPKELLPLIFQVWVGQKEKVPIHIVEDFQYYPAYWELRRLKPSPFFWALKNNQKPKWKKAVKLLFSELGKRGVRFKLT